MSEAAVFRTALRGNQVCELSPGSGSGLLHCMASSIPVITKGVITGWSSPLSVALEELTSLSPAFWKLTCEVVHDEILRTSLARALVQTFCFLLVVLLILFSWSYCPLQLRLLFLFVQALLPCLSSSFLLARIP